MPKLASQRFVAFSSIASNTGARLPGELLMICRISPIAACWASASSRSAVRASSSRRSASTACLGSICASSGIAWATPTVTSDDTPLPPIRPAGVCRGATAAAPRAAGPDLPLASVATVPILASCVIDKYRPHIMAIKQLLRHAPEFRCHSAAGRFSRLGNSPAGRCGRSVQTIDFKWRWADLREPKWMLSLSSGTSRGGPGGREDRKSTRLNSSHSQISYAVFCLKKKKKNIQHYYLKKKKKKKLKKNT